MLFFRLGAVEYFLYQFAYFVTQSISPWVSSLNRFSLVFMVLIESFISSQFQINFFSFLNRTAPEQLTEAMTQSTPLCFQISWNIFFQRKPWHCRHIRLETDHNNTRNLRPGSTCKWYGSFYLHCDVDCKNSLSCINWFSSMYVLAFAFKILNLTQF